MSNKELLKRERAKLRLRMLANFKDVPIVEVQEIPVTRSLFPGTASDYWERINLPEHDDRSSCLYELGPKGIFATHIHAYASETCELLTPGAKVEWVTEEDIYFLEYPAVFKVPKNMMHALVSLVDFKIDIRVDWRPKMVGWEGDFLKKNDV
jgi:hypothetical protein|tara:strand:+ start:39985 stop:40440 length:456 start_codon:yes stop_codon:yes gene_type:complete